MATATKKKPAKKATAKKTVAKKVTAKKKATKKPVAKKTVTRKVTAKKTVAKKQIAAAQGKATVNLIKRGLLIGLGAAVQTSTKVKAVVEKQVKQLAKEEKMSATEAKKFGKEIANFVTAEKKNVEKRINDSVEAQLSKMVKSLKLVTQNDLKALKSDLKGTKKTATKKATTKKKPATKKATVKKIKAKTATKKVAARAASAKKITAKKITAKKATTKKSVAKKASAKK